MGRHLICAPYDDGRLDWRMGAGARLIASEAGPAAEAIDDVDPDRPPIGRAFDLAARLSAHVREARERGDHPVVLAGNCNSALGTASGLDGRVGVVWFDAHADFDTPDDNESGFFDVMGLSILTGTGWRALRETIPSFRPVREEDVVLAAVRDLEPYQRERLERSAITVVPGRVEAGPFEAAVDALAGRVDSVYLHIDLDAVDPSDGRANQYAAPGGPPAADLLARVELVRERLPVGATALTAYDPEADPERRVLALALELLRPPPPPEAPSASA
ncbi:MAG TPA: arginase family protein [Thermoleophilaceae bacterium]